MTCQQPTTIAILRTNTVVDQALALLLMGEGYGIKFLQASPMALADGLLDGVDLLLFPSGLSNGVRDVLLSAVRANPKTAAKPVLTLCRATGEVVVDNRSVPVAWPTRTENLTREIEAALPSDDAPRRLLLGDPVAGKEENNTPDQ